MNKGEEESEWRIITDRKLIERETVNLATYDKKRDTKNVKKPE
jgi:hypothetical protein